MAQEYIVIHEPASVKPELHEALLQCETCSKIVPKTMLCLYCGTPILYRPPQSD